MKTIFLILIVTLLIPINLLSQTIPYNQEFQVNTYTKNNQYNPAIAALPDGRFVVCWESNTQDGSDYGIFGQLFDACGSKKGSEFQVNTYNVRSQTNAVLTALPDGGFVVCWNSNLPDGSGYGVLGQMFDAAGNKKGNEFQVNTNVMYHEKRSALTALPDGGFVVCWYKYDIFGQMFDAAGNKKGNEFQVNTYIPELQSNPAVASFPDSGFVVCWESFQQDGSSSGIFGQLFDAAGNRKGSEFRVNTFTYNDQTYPAVAILPNGGFVVCWASWGQDGPVYNGVVGQLFDAAGNRKGSEFQVNTFTNLNQEDPAVTALPNGGFVICWQSDNQDGSKRYVFGQLFDVDGNKKGSEFQVNTYINSNQRDPAVAVLPNNGFVVCWAGYGIFGKYFLSEPIIHQLTSFSIIEPLHDASVNTIHPTFKWHPASEVRKCYYWEIAYDLYLDTYINFSHPRIISDIYDTTYTIDSLNRAQTYFWKVLAKNLAGDSLFSSETRGFYVKPDAIIGVEDESTAAMPIEFQLLQNYPNPFNATTEIKYSLPKGMDSFHVTLKIYDALGRLVKILVSENQTTGDYAVTWDGTDMTGKPVTSGVYFYTLNVGDFRLTKKMLLLQ